MRKVLVLGSDGQMGQCLKSVVRYHDTQLAFIFLNRYTSDITSPAIAKEIADIAPDFVVNFAAYTAVDKAESEPTVADLINHKALSYICEGVNICNASFIHLSTDYVYNSLIMRPLLENDICQPRGVYAKTKLLGEEYIRQNLKKHIIIRTSWIFSEFGHNFVKTMVRLMSEKNSISIVDDQIGSPTYGVYLADAICSVMSKIDRFSDYKVWGTYNYSNHGAISWFEFANEIKSLIGASTTLVPISTDQYQAIAPRPAWSVLSNRKWLNVFDHDIPGWYQGMLKTVLKVK